MLSIPGSSSPDSDEGTPPRTPVPDSTRRTTHTGKQTGMCYGLGVAWHHLRPFIPFILVSILVVILIYLLQTIIYGGPFKDPLFFAKFNERWPRPNPVHPGPSAPSYKFRPVPTPSLEEILFGRRIHNGTA